MAEGDVTHPNHFKYMLLQAYLNGKTVKAMLVNATPNIDTWENKDDVTGEISATGYTAGGKTLGAFTFTENDTNDRGEWDFPDLTWTSLATATINNIVFYYNSGVASTSVVIGWMESATNSNGGDYTVQINANGFTHLS